MGEVKLVAAIVGGSGSGKSTLIKAVRDHFSIGDVCLVSQDDHYYPVHQQHSDAQGKVNFDLPSAIDMDALLTDISMLKQGIEITRKEYTFNNASHTGATKSIAPAPLLLVEGLFVLHDERVRSIMDTTIFIDATEEHRLERRLRRDARERGYGHDDVMYQWQNHVEPAFKQYLEPHRDSCDMLVGNDADLRDAADRIAQHLVAMMEKHSNYELV